MPCFLLSQKKNRLKNYLESLQPSEYSDDFSTGLPSTPAHVETVATSPTYVETVATSPAYVETLATQPSQYAEPAPTPSHYTEDNSLAAGYEDSYIQTDTDRVLYTSEDHKLYQYGAEKSLSYEGTSEIVGPDTMMTRLDGRKSILEYAAHDIIMEDQQNAALIYSMYDETGAYDTLPLFPDEFAMSCYNNIPPMI